MFDSGELLRWATLLLLIMWRIYWHVTEVASESEKPIQKEKLPFFHKKNVSKYVVLAAFGIAGVQLAGVSLVPMPEESQVMQVIGFIFAVIGITVSIIGRHNLGTNWARCYDYQVKQKQDLVTHGIYRFIRHPVYAGISLFLIGAELVVQSYFVFPYLLLFLGAYIQARWEEQLLIQHFGNQYKSYMTHTKRFIPYVW